MCDSVHLYGREYQTPAELAGLIGGTEKLVWQTTNSFVLWPEGKTGPLMDGCLCPVDLAATLNRAGFEWKIAPDPMEWVIVENSN
jgi:hypothetical protein